MEYTLITGASSGIGEALAISLSKKSNLLLVGRNSEKLEKVRLKCYNSDNHKLFICDLSSERTRLFQQLTALLIRENITIQNMIYSAGITKILPIKNISVMNIDEIFTVNLFSAIEILKTLLKKDNKKSLKNVIFISSLWSIRGEVGNSIYAASKGALNALTFSLAKELAPTIRVNSILPGAVKTPMTEMLLESEIGQRQLKDYPLGLGECSDITDYVEFLLSEKARWITGQLIKIDGGRSVL